MTGRHERHHPALHPTPPSFPPPPLLGDAPTTLETPAAAVDARFDGQGKLPLRSAAGTQPEEDLCTLL